MNYQRLIISVTVFVVVLVIPILSGIFFGFDWEVYGWWIFCGALGSVVLVDLIRTKRKK